MTEQNRPTGRELTNKANPPRLEDKGDIFMAEPGEGQKPPEQPTGEPKAPLVPPPSPDLETSVAAPIPISEDTTAITLEDIRKELKGIKPRKGEKPLSDEEIEAKAQRIFKVKSGGSGGGEPPGEKPPVGAEEPEESGEKGEEGEVKKSTHSAEKAGRVDKEHVQEVIDELKNLEFKLVLQKLIGFPKDQVDTDFLQYLLEDLHKARGNLLDKLNSEIERKLIEEYGSQGEASKRIREKRDEINDQIKKIQNEFDRVKDEIWQLVPERGADSSLQGIVDEIEKMPDSPKKTEALIKLMEAHNPEDNVIPDELLLLLSKDKVAYHRFLTRLTVFDLEDQPYMIRGLYSTTNYEKFLRVSRETITNEDRENVLSLITATEAFHNMNYFLRRSFDQFGNAAQSLLPDHFQVLSQIEGVDLVQRLYEFFGNKYLGTTTRIKNKDLKKIDRKVQAAFRVMAGKKGENGELLKGMGGGEMAEWERFRAYVFGRNMFRVYVRQAEQAALGELPDDVDPAMWISHPQKELAQILNNPKIILVRFAVEKALGGLALTTEARKEQKAKKSLLNRLAFAQGTNVDDREFQGVCGARGVFATWRFSKILGHLLAFKDTSGNITDSVGYVLDHRAKIRGLNERSEAITKREKKARKVTKDTKKARDELKKEVKTFFAPFLENTSIGLGMLVSSNALPNIPPEFKELVWDKVAEYSPLVTANMLSRLEMDSEMRDKTREIPLSLEQILLEVWGTEEQKVAFKQGPSLREMRVRLEENKESTDEQFDKLRIQYKEKEELVISLLECGKWEDMETKLNIANELRIKAETYRLNRILKRERFIKSGQEGPPEREVTEPPQKLEDFLKGELALDEGELRVLGLIRENGKKISRDLANTKHPYAWFLNDIPFKDLNWEELGQFYDRETNDLGKFHKFNTSIQKFISNTFSRPMIENLKDLREASDGVTEVLGREDAVRAVDPWFKSALNFIQTKPGMRQIFIHEIMHSLRRPTSRAQEVLKDVKAPSATDFDIREIIEVGLNMGLETKESHDELVKKYHVGLLNLYGWAYERDWGPFGLAALIYLFFKRVFSSSNK